MQLHFYEQAQFNHVRSVFKESVECGGGVMMVDGSSHFPIPPPPHLEVKLRDTTASTSVTTTTVSSTTPPADSSSEPPTSIPDPPDATPGPSSSTAVVSSSGRSRWMKLRNTVQLSNAIQGAVKKEKPPLKREDSFLKRFSTRQIPDPSCQEGSSRLAGDGVMKSPYLGVWRSVVNPDENILFYWLSLLTVCLLYNAWTIIVRQAFPELQSGLSIMWFCIDGFTDLVFIMDIVFQFRTGYLEQGLMVCESKKLAFHYMKSRSFVMDICSILPMDLLQLYVGIMPILRFPRFLKLYRSFRLYYMVESRTIYPNLWRVVNLIHILLLLAHWFGCFYYLLSELEGFVGEWSYRLPVGEYANLSRKYLGSVYWSTLTLTTIGDLATPATNLQYMFTIISYLIGVFIFATIVGQVGTVITNRNASRLEFERLLDGAKLYMRHHKVPLNMQRRVQRWYDYSWSRGRMQGGGDINSALGILPDKLKTELALHVNLKTLKKVSIFQECQPEFLHDLVLKMRAYIFTPGDLICRKGEVAREMFIIADGILEVISETGRVLTQMKAGDFFGEIGILNLDGFNRRTADVRSVGYSELFSLSREDILAAMKDYPEAQDILQKMGRKRLLEARMAANIGRTVPSITPPVPPTATQGQTVIDLGESSNTRPKVPNKIKKCRNIKKILRTRTQASGNSSDLSENIEMKPMKSGTESDLVVNLEERKKNVSFTNFIQKINFKREDSTTSVKSFTEKRSNPSSKVDEHSFMGESSSNSDESADSSTPLNKSLPLLQRVLMLGVNEKKEATAAASPKSIFKSTPKLSDKEDNKTGASLKSEKDIGKESQPSSPRSKTNPFTSLLTAVIPKGGLSPPRSPKNSPKKSPKKGGGDGGPSSPEVQKKSPPSLKGRLAEGGELPLLKKVLLRQVMDDNKLEVIKTDSQECSLDGPDGDQSEETVSNRVYLEQFSRTLGFKMSEDPVPRPRLNASSLTPSPSHENFQELFGEEGEKMKPLMSPPKGRLSRMMAVREDSDENSVMTEDPFVKSTECQTELIGKVGSLGEMVNQTKMDQALRNYLTKMFQDLETVIKAYSEQYTHNLLEEDHFLQSSEENKEDYINKLKSRVEYESNAYEPFEEVSSLGASSISVPEFEFGKDNLFSKKEVNNGSTPTYDEDDDDERDLEDEEVMMLQERLKVQRKSWPTSVSVRRKIGTTKQSSSLDDETQGPPVTDPEWGWRLEFPPPPPELEEPPWCSGLKPIFTTVPESLVEDVNPGQEEELNQPEDNSEQEDANDWELKMLVEQFEENVHINTHRNRGRRHSSGEALSWDAVLRSRNASGVRAKKHSALSASAAHLGGIGTRRKYSLVETGSVWRKSEATSISHSNSYSSLANLAGRPSHSMAENNCFRRTSVSQISSRNPFLPNPDLPTARKSSLPTLPQQQSSRLMSMAQWMSMEQVKDNNKDHEYSHQASMSSGCSQETVIEMDTKFSSVDNVNRYNSDASTLGTRSPSSPNVASDRDAHMSLDFSGAPHLSDWPSSPCLPTIREDDQCANTPSMSSPGRSVSHDCLPQAATLQQNHHSTDVHSPGNSDSFPAFGRLFDQENYQDASVVLNMNPPLQTPNPTSENPFYSGTKATNVSKTSASDGVTF
ncbi:hypothetical protein JTE90_020186 [Oedothorax gibbosus]|uniref:Cyclic nucleotide-binding domain-containing protein n=1 Tax=Oedothorax gibbosus TaxID=931172 RepID=A0AAV6U1N0_9ARAC|nr:hypothetical protein JTE90_020186 [Oedothorax gibbosus]